MHTCPSPGLACQFNRPRAALSSSASTPSAPFVGQARESSRSRNAGVPGKERLSSSAPASAGQHTRSQARSVVREPGMLRACCPHRHTPEFRAHGTGRPSTESACRAPPGIPMPQAPAWTPPTSQPSLNSLAGALTFDDLKRPRARGGHDRGVRISGGVPSTARPAPVVGGSPLGGTSGTHPGTVAGLRSGVLQLPSCPLSLPKIAHMQCGSIRCGRLCRCMQIWVRWRPILPGCMLGGMCAGLVQRPASSKKSNPAMKPRAHIHACPLRSTTRMTAGMAC